MADIAITAANVQYVSGEKEVVTYGATITAGQLLYKDAADNKYKPSDANGVSAAKTVDGIALCNGSDGQPGVILKVPGDTPAEITIGGTTAIGTVYVLSATAGGIAPAADLASGMTTVVIGVGGPTTSKLKVKIINSGQAVP